MKEYDVQVATDSYLTSIYLDQKRFVSYGYQILEVLALTPGNVLEIGLGNGIVSSLLGKLGVKITTLDFDRSLRPDVVGLVTQLPLKAGAFDVVLCCQVLEHIPYSDFTITLRQLYETTRRFVILGLPDQTPHIAFEAAIPKLGTFKRIVSLPFPRKLFSFDGEHYWQIGAKGYSLEKIKLDITSSGFRILKTYQLWEHRYHRIFLLEKSHERLKPGMGTV